MSLLMSKCFFIASLAHPHSKRVSGLVIYGSERIFNPGKILLFNDNMMKTFTIPIMLLMMLLKGGQPSLDVKCGGAGQ